MSGKKDIIWVADQIVSTLQSNLNAKMVTLDTEYGDSITLDPFENENFYISEVQKLAGFPLVAVIPERTTTGSNGGEIRYGLERHELTIAAALVGNEGEDVLKRRVGRTIRAIQEVLEDAPTLSDTVEDIVVSLKQYSPLLAAENALLQEAQLTVQVITFNPD